MARCKSWPSVRNICSEGILGFINFAAFAFMDLDSSRVFVTISGCSKPMRYSIQEFVATDCGSLFVCR